MRENETAYHVVRTWGLSESQFDARCIEVARAAVVGAFTPSSFANPRDMAMYMKSCAGHDSAWMSKVVPTSMIFVPSKCGVSHNPNEYTSQEHCALGA